MKFKVFFILVFLSVFVSVLGQELDTLAEPPEKIFIEIKETDNQIYPKEFQDNFKNKYQSEEFDYTATKPKDSLWNKLKQAVIDILENIFGKFNPDIPLNFTETFIRIVSVIIIGFLLYLLTRYLLKKDGNFFWSKKNQNIEILANEIQENIHEINFPQTISKLEREKDFRSAIRYQFLWILKQLSDKKLITWNPEKTNRDYISEIQSSDLKKVFKDITLIFDYVWYGEFKIDEPTYWNLVEKWKDLNI